MTIADTIALLIFGLAATYPVAFLIAWPFMAWRKAKWEMQGHRANHIYRKRKKDVVR